MRTNGEGAPANPSENMPAPPPSDGSIERELGITPKVCSRCGTSNLPASYYCYKCGQKLPETLLPDKKICAGCHAPNASTAQFCYRCGLRLPEQAAAVLEAVQYAGFWRRVAAYLIDGFFINIASDVILAIVLFIVSAVSPGFGQSYSPLDLMLGTSSDIPSWFWLVTLGVAVIGIAYWTIATGWKGQTVGKLMLGMKVVRTDGGRVGYGRAFGRFWSYFLCWWTLGAGFLPIAWTRQKRGLHDLICDTMVIRT